MFCLDRRRERAMTASPVWRARSDQPLSVVVMCRKRRQEGSPVEGLSTGTRNGISWSGRCVAI